MRALILHIIMNYKAWLSYAKARLISRKYRKSGH